MGTNKNQPGTPRGEVLELAARRQLAESVWTHGFERIVALSGVAEATVKRAVVGQPVGRLFLRAILSALPTPLPADPVTIDPTSVARAIKALDRSTVST